MSETVRVVCVFCDGGYYRIWPSRRRLKCRNCNGSGTLTEQRLSEIRGKAIPSPVKKVGKA